MMHARAVFWWAVFYFTGPLSVQLEALVRAYHNADMKPGKHVSNVRLQVKQK